MCRLCEHAFTLGGLQEVRVRKCETIAGKRPPRAKDLRGQLTSAGKNGVVYTAAKTRTLLTSNSQVAHHVTPN